ncbi:hypothetical protein [Undibacterium sp. TS12]|nr:hypothetical protein [Undibacterium sp. TS12]
MGENRAEMLYYFKADARILKEIALAAHIWVKPLSSSNISFPY